MSRVGRKPIPLPSGVQVTRDGSDVKVKGPKGELTMQLQPGIAMEENDSVIQLTRENENREGAALYGLTRALLANCVEGVSKGFSRGLEIQGTGYRAQMKGKNLELLLGFSHPILFETPKDIEIKVEGNTKVIVAGIDKQRVGQVAADIRAYRPPEPYKGKGVRYENEQIRRKAGKSAAGAA